jgi:KamA family protein
VPLSSTERGQLERVVERHPMSVTRYYFSLVNSDDPNDPIRRLIIPSADELDLSGSYDTSGEVESTKMPGLQHKYAQTALLLATNRCAAYCRYCFRKRLVGLPSKEIVERFETAARYIRDHPEITNVLVSGGDPLVLPTHVLRRLLDVLSPIEHLDFIRIGTRIPVVFPKRIIEDEELSTLLESYSRDRKRIYIVTQYNHERELTDLSVRSIRKLIRSGLAISNQTVLLKGVNDDPADLAALMKKLLRSGITPYYVFQCRPVKRVKRRFQVPLRRGSSIVEDARRMLDGHAKRFRYVMSHRTGKVEIIGVVDNRILLKYHQARNPSLLGRVFWRRLSETAGWLDDLAP